MLGAKPTHKQLLHGPVGLVNRCVRVGCSSGIGIGDRDLAETGVADPVRCLPHSSDPALAKLIVWF